TPLLLSSKRAFHDCSDDISSRLPAPDDDSTVAVLDSPVVLYDDAATCPLTTPNCTLSSTLNRLLVMLVSSPVVKVRPAPRFTMLEVSSTRLGAMNDDPLSNEMNERPFSSARESASNVEPAASDSWSPLPVTCVSTGAENV